MSSSILILGGTTEARRLAQTVSSDGRFVVTVSLAGRTKKPVSHAVPVRTGGFGGAQGLADYLRVEHVELVVDATHPFAENISANAVSACALAGVGLIVLRRPAWVAEPGDRWTMHENILSAVAALGVRPRRVLVALGRQELKPLDVAPQHHYLVRSVDPVDPPLAIPHVDYILDRGPFDLAQEQVLLTDHRIDGIICKNSGGEASRAKLVAARKLQIPVEMIARPQAAGIPGVATVAEAVGAIDHWACSPAKRGE